MIVSQSDPSFVAASTTDEDEEETVNCASDFNDMFLTLSYRNELLATSYQACFSLAMYKMFTSIASAPFSIDTAVHREIIQARRATTPTQTPLQLTTKFYSDALNLHSTVIVWRI